MDRYSKSNGVDVAPVAPPAPDHPYYTSGDPQNDIPATTPGPWLFHMLIESMRNVIVAAGLTPSYTDLNLFRDAIKVLIAGGDYKASCRVASTAALNLAAPGANIDGVAMVAGERVLLKDQAAPAQNGLWIWNGAAVAMTRAPDADAGSELNSGAIVPIEQGTLNADTNWQLITDGAIVIGVTALTFQLVSAQNFASAAEAQALSSLTKAISPGTLAAAFQAGNQSLGASGYQKLPGGLILQWGSDTTSRAEGVFTINMNVTYPTAQISFTSNMNNSASSTTQEYSTQVRSLSTTQALLFLQGHAGASGNSTGIFWMSLGY